MENTEFTVERVRRLLQPGNTFCAIPFVEWSATVGEKPHRVCCHSIHSKELSRAEMQQAVVDNQKLAACANCYNNEQNKMTSFRQVKTIKALKHYPERLIAAIDAFYTNEPIEYTEFDFTVSNKCNYACIMCNATASDIIAKEHGIQAPLLETPLSDQWPTIAPGAIVSIAGGEPQIQKQTLEILNKVPRECTVVLTTNASVFNEKIFNKLVEFADYQISVSIDGIGAVGEAIRRYSSWHVVEKNVNNIIQKVGANKVVIRTVLLKDNINDLYNIGSWMSKLGLTQWDLTNVRSVPELEWHRCQNIDYNSLQRCLEEFPLDPKTVFTIKSILNSQAR